MVFATAIRLLANPVEAEDVAQNVFLRAFQHYGEIERSPAAAGWLKTATRNACLNHLSRYRARWRFFSELSPETGDGPGDNYEDQLVSDAPITDGLERQEEHARLEQALAELPDRQRVPLVLFHFEDMSYQEIAATLGISVGKVKTDIHRGRMALKQQLGGPARAVR